MARVVYLSHFSERQSVLEGSASPDALKTETISGGRPEAFSHVCAVIIAEYPGFHCLSGSAKSIFQSVTDRVGTSILFWLMSPIPDLPIKERLVRTSLKTSRWRSSWSTALIFFNITLLCVGAPFFIDYHEKAWIATWNSEVNSSVNNHYQLKEQRNR